MCALFSCFFSPHRAVSFFFPSVQNKNEFLHAIIYWMVSCDAGNWFLFVQFIYLTLNHVSAYNFFFRHNFLSSQSAGRILDEIALLRRHAQHLAGKTLLSLLVLLNFAFKTSHNKFSIVYKSIERIYLHSHTAALKKKKRCTLSFVVSWRWHCSISGSLMCRCLESCCHVIVIVIEILLLKFDFKIKPLLAHNDGVLVCCCISCSLFYSLLHLLACIFVLAAFWPFANIRMLIV